MYYLIKDYETGEAICTMRTKKGTRFEIKESIREFNSYFTKGEDEDGYYEGCTRNEWVANRLGERFNAKIVYFNDGDYLYI